MAGAAVPCEHRETTAFGGGKREGGQGVSVSGTIRVATRGSLLALAQTERVIAALRRIAPDCLYQPYIIHPEGDRDKTTPLAVLGGQGVFVVGVQEAVQDGRAHLAVHSAKDVPPATPEGLTIAAYPERVDPRDVFVSRHGVPLAELPAGATVGTSSRRRAVQALATNPGVRVIELRGNLDTRLRKSDTAQYDGIIVAAAGLERMGWADRATEYLPVATFVPAPAQGAIAVECRSDDADTIALLARIDDAEARTTVTAERAGLSAIGAGCRSPFALHAQQRGERLHLWGMMADEDGANARWLEEVAPGGESLPAGVHLARMLAGMRTNAEVRV